MSEDIYRVGNIIHWNPFGCNPDYLRILNRYQKESDQRGKDFDTMFVLESLTLGGEPFTWVYLLVEGCECLTYEQFTQRMLEQ